MTNKTINGVPRELLVTIATTDALNEYRKYRLAVDEICALLAAPDPAKCRNCGLSTAEQCDDIGCGLLSAGNGAPDPIVDAEKVNNREMGLMQFIEAHPIVEADGIGEPVAYYFRFAGYVAADGPQGWRTEIEIERPAEFLFEDGRVKEFMPLYSADQLAALQSTIAQLKAENERFRGGLKLPERKEVCPSHPYLSDLDIEWNACLDEVRRMNEVKP